MGISVPKHRVSQRFNVCINYIKHLQCRFATLSHTKILDPCLPVRMTCPFKEFKEIANPKSARHTYPNAHNYFHMHCDASSSSSSSSSSHTIVVVTVVVVTIIVVVIFFVDRFLDDNYYVQYSAHSVCSALRLWILAAAVLSIPSPVTWCPFPMNAWPSGITSCSEHDVIPDGHGFIGNGVLWLVARGAIWSGGSEPHNNLLKCLFSIYSYIFFSYSTRCGYIPALPQNWNAKAEVK